MLIIKAGKNPDAATFRAIDAFLFPFEKNCVSLIDRLHRHDVPVFCILGAMREILGVFTYSSGGQILHCVPCAVSRYDELLASLRIYFESFDLHSLFSIIGDEAGTNLFLSAIFLSTRRLPAVNESFFLMEHFPSKVSAGSGLKIPIVDSFGRQTVFAGSCPSSLLDALLIMQEAYEREEVLQDGQEFNPLLSKFVLKKGLSENRVYAAFFCDKIVAKSVINAEGRKFSLLGGVFTEPEFRRKGFAEFLIKRLCAEKARQGKIVVLFVKPKNVAALTLYKRCGFCNFGKLKISYF